MTRRQGWQDDIRDDGMTVRIAQKYSQKRESRPGVCLCASSGPDSECDDAGQSPQVLYHSHQGSLIDSDGDPGQEKEGEAADDCGGDGEEVRGELWTMLAGMRGVDGGTYRVETDLSERQRQVCPRWTLRNVAEHW